MRVMFPIALISLTLASSVATVGTSQAADFETRSVRVSYADLNLASPAGVRTLDRRIKQAVNQICGGPGFGLESRHAWSTCAKGAFASAVPQVTAALIEARGEAYADASVTMSRR